MAKRTEREFHIALGKLLDRVRVQNSWSKDSFYTAATHVANISQSEAIRFYRALVEMNLLTPGTNKRKLAPNFDTVVYKNTDKMLGLVKDVLGSYPDILQQRGPKLGSHHKPKVEMALEVVQEETINPLEYFSAQDLVSELRNRGYVVTCEREIITVEKL